MLFLNNGGHANETWKRLMEAGTNDAIDTLKRRATRPRALGAGPLQGRLRARQSQKTNWAQARMESVARAL